MVSSPGLLHGHVTNARTTGMPHEAGPYVCWCIEDVGVLQQEVLDLRAEIECRQAVVAAAESYVLAPDERGFGRLSQAVAALLATWRSRAACR